MTEAIETLSEFPPITKEKLIEQAGGFIEKKEPVIVGGWKPAPQTFEEQQRLATMYVKSGVLPSRFKDVAQVLTALHFAAEHFPGKEMTALRQIAVIEGSPCMFGDLPLALVQRSGLLEEMSETWEGDGDKLTCTVMVKRKDLEKITRTFSVEDAKKAKLWDRKTYQAYPKRMLQMRTRSWALKDGFADVLAGIAVAEWDFHTDGSERDVTSSKLDELNSLGEQ